MPTASSIPSANTALHSCVLPFRGDGPGRFPAHAGLVLPAFSPGVFPVLHLRFPDRQYLLQQPLLPDLFAGLFVLFRPGQPLDVAGWRLEALSDFPQQGCTQIPLVRIIHILPALSCKR